MTIGIAELARRTGLSQQAIRAWETRFDFPVPERTAGGRRSYDVADVDRLQRVVALKESGVRLAQAIARVRTEVSSGPLSVYSAVRERHPQVESRRLRRDVLVAISRAIEDEAMARATKPVVFGAFQRESFFRQAAGRWGEIARTSSLCVVLADFPEPARGPGAPVEVPLPADSPLLREWAVVVLAPSLSVALTAWEVPSQDAGDDREFESVFTFDPAAVRTAAEVCASAARAASGSSRSLLAALDSSLAVEPTASHGVDALVVRSFEYLQRLQDERRAAAP
ncbi:MAG: DICT sensory domain-containing protein [Nocardioides sp.]